MSIALQSDEEEICVEIGGVELEVGVWVELEVGVWDELEVWFEVEGEDGDIVEE